MPFRPDGYIPPCIPTRAAKPPTGPAWIHEIKHDGYRLQVRRDGDVVKLFTRRGYDWSDRYPGIVATATQLRATSFTLDGEACVCGPDGVAIFEALHRHGTVTEAMLYAFDLLELEGEDLRGLPLGDRKKRLARLQAADRHRSQPAYRRGRRCDLPAGMPDGPGGHRVEAAERALPVGPLAGLAQDQEPGQPGDDPRAGS
jgi:ATP-dependent DNA ligase